MREMRDERREKREGRSEKRERDCVSGGGGLCLASRKAARTACSPHSTFDPSLISMVNHHRHPGSEHEVYRTHRIWVDACDLTALPRFWSLVPVSRRCFGRCATPFLRLSQSSRAISVSMRPARAGGGIRVSWGGGWRPWQMPPSATLSSSV